MYSFSITWQLHLYSVLTYDKMTKRRAVTCLYCGSLIHFLISSHPSPAPWQHGALLQLPHHLPWKGWVATLDKHWMIISCVVWKKKILVKWFHLFLKKKIFLGKKIGILHNFISWKELSHMQLVSNLFNHFPEWRLKLILFGQKRHLLDEHTNFLDKVLKYQKDLIIFYVTRNSSCWNSRVVHMPTCLTLLLTTLETALDTRRGERPLKSPLLPSTLIMYCAETKHSSCELLNLRFHLHRRFTGKSQQTHHRRRNQVSIRLFYQTWWYLQMVEEVHVLPGNIKEIIYFNFLFNSLRLVGFVKMQWLYCRKVSHCMQKTVFLKIIIKATVWSLDDQVDPGLLHHHY